MHSRSLCVCMIVTGLLIIDVLCQDISCLSPDSLLKGRRRIVSAVFRASNARSGYPASQARLDDDGWCSGLLATSIFDPYIEVDFGIDLILTSITTEGNIVNPFIITGGFIERYRVEVAGADGNFQFIASLANNSQPVPAIFPLGQSRISNDTIRHTESLPRPVIGQILRINPYEWSDDDHVCTKLEVFGCPLQECRSESQLNSNQYVNSVIVNGLPINTGNLFEFGNTDVFHCGPSDVGSFNITITYSSPVLLTEIGIHGDNRFLGTSIFDDYVISFSLSFSEDDDNFTEYIRDTGSTVFSVSDAEQHFFALWPPITASSIKITINRWNDRPCMSLLMLGCNYSDVVNHSINGTAAGTNSGLLDDMTVTLTTTEFMTTTTELVIVTATVTQMITEGYTITADLNCTPSPSPIQSSGAVGSTSSDTDNTPIYVAVAIVMVGLLMTITANIVGVILCRRYCQEKRSNNEGPLFVKCKFENNTEPSLVDTKNAGVGLDEKLKPESVPTSVSASGHKNQRVETVNMHYESVINNDPRCTITDQNKNTQSSSKNDPAIVDNPAYSTTSGPPLIDNPAYVAVN